MDWFSKLEVSKSWSETLNNDFDKNGIIVVKNFLNTSEVVEFRDLFDAKFSQNQEKKYFGYDELEFGPQILERIIDMRLAGELKKIFAQPILMPDFILQAGNTPKVLLTPHYDCQSYLRQGMSKQLSNLNYAKIGLYLQDSDLNQPGAIWYVPGSHKDKFSQQIIKSRAPVFLKIRFDRLCKQMRKGQQVPLKCKAGDLVIFHGRLLHSSSPATKIANNKIERKLAVYFSVAGSKSDARSFMRSEFLKFSDEITSDNYNDNQRIGYVFSDIGKKMDGLCRLNNLDSFPLDGSRLRDFKHPV